MKIEHIQIILICIAAIFIGTAIVIAFNYSIIALLVIVAIYSIGISIVLERIDTSEE